MSTILERIGKAQRDLDVAADEIRKCQSECSHPVEALKVTRQSNYSEKDPLEALKFCHTYKCQICTKFWIVNQ